MAVRDPAFWHRFSVAVHKDEESKGPVYATTTTISSPSSPPLKHQDSWLGRQEAKKRRRAIICWAFWLAFAGVIVGAVFVVLWLKTSGVLDRLMDKVDAMVEPGSAASASPTPTPTPTPPVGGGANGKRALEGMRMYTYYG
ncbi:MAG: hypothetical protein Q9165_005021 [Trypethelium subeluteriae]